MNHLATHNLNGMHLQKRNNCPFSAHSFDAPDNPDTLDGTAELGQHFFPSHALMLEERDIDTQQHQSLEQPVDTTNPLIFIPPIFQE